MKIKKTYVFNNYFTLDGHITTNPNEASLALAEEVKTVGARPVDVKVAKKLNLKTGDKFTLTMEWHKLRK